MVIRNQLGLFYKFIFISIIMYFLHVILIRIINIHINNFYISGLMTMSLTAIIAFYLNKKVFTIKNTVNNSEQCLNKPS